VVQVYPAAAISASDIVTPARELVSPNDARLTSLPTAATSSINFGSQSRLMSTSLSRAVVRFGGLIPSGVTMGVEQTYAAAATWPATSSGIRDLMFEGRAIELTYTTTSASSRGSVFAAATQCGVDFVNQTTDGSRVTLVMAVLPAACTLNQLDIAFLVDGSGSISDTEWNDTKTFLLAITAVQDVGSDRTRVAITTFSSSRNINPNRTHWPNETDCPVGSMWLAPSAYPESVSQVGHPSSACVCEGGVTCTPSSNQAECTNLGSRDSNNAFVHAYRNSGVRGACGTTGGTGTFHDGIPAGGVRNDLTFAGGVTRATVNSAILSMQRPGGFTWTRAGIEMVRSSIFSTTTGMRSASAAVPRVLVLVTDGQATCLNANACFEPAEAAQALRDDGITVLAVGVGGGLDRQELVEIGGSERNVFQVSNFAQLPDISSEIDGRSCGACATLAVDTISTISLTANEYTCAQLCGEALSVSVTVTTGLVDIYTSPTRFGGPRNFSEAVLGVGPGATATLIYPGTGFLIFRGRTAGTIAMTQFASTTAPLDATVTASVEHNDTVGVQVANLTNQVTTFGSEYNFVATSGETAHFSVSPTGIVTIADALTDIQSSTVTLVIRAAPRRSGSFCSSPAPGDPVVIITLTVTVSSEPQSAGAGEQDNSGATAGAVIGVLLLLALLALLGLVLYKRRREPQAPALPTKSADVVNPVLSVSNRGNAVANESYMAIPPKRPPPPQRPAPSSSHGAALSNDLYQAAAPPVSMEPSSGIYEEATITAGAAGTPAVYSVASGGGPAAPPESLYQMAQPTSLPDRDGVATNPSYLPLVPLRLPSESASSSTDERYHKFASHEGRRAAPSGFAGYDGVIDHQAPIGTAGETPYDGVLGHSAHSTGAENYLDVGDEPERGDNGALLNDTYAAPPDGTHGTALVNDVYQAPPTPVAVLPKPVPRSRPPSVKSGAPSKPPPKPAPRKVGSESVVGI